MEDLDKKGDDLKKAEELTDELAQQPGVDAQPIKKKTADVKDKHQKAKEKTTDKKEKLVEYIIYIEEYYEIIEEITEWVYVTKPKPELNEPIATDPKTLKKQLKDTEELQDEFVEKKPKMERVLVIIEYITMDCPNDVTVVSEVQTIYQNAKKPFEDTGLKIDVRTNRLRSTLAQSQKFQESLDDFLDNLSHLGERLNNEKPVSAKLETVKEQKAEHAQVHNDVVQMEPVFAQICTSANEVLENAEPGEEKDQLKEKIDDVKEKFQTMKEKSTDREKVLADEVDFCEKFAQQHKPFNSWLDTMEAKLNELTPLACEEDSVQRQVKDVKNLVQETGKNEPKIVELEETAKSAVDNAEVDQVFVEEDSKNDRKRFDELKANVDEKDKKLDELLPLAQDYTKELKPVDEVLDKVEKVTGVAQQPMALNEDKIKEEKKKLDDLAKELEETKPVLEKFNDTSKKLQEEADEESPELPVVKKETENTNDRFDKLQDDLKGRKEKLDDYADKAEKFNKDDEEFKDWMDKASKTPGLVEPVGTEPDVLKRQLKEVEVCFL